MALLRWYRESANALLPAGALVGQAAAARLLARRGMPGEMAGATATVDLTLEAVSQLFFTLAGVALLLGAGEGEGLLGFAAAGFGIALGGAAAMLAFQRHLPLALLERGLARLARRWPALRPEWVHDAAGGDPAPCMPIGRGWSLATLWHTAAWLSGVVEVAGMLWLHGAARLRWPRRMVIESLAQALRNAGFMLPGALAVQEGAIIGAAALVGRAAGAALGMALVRRAREVCLGLPGLIGLAAGRRHGYARRGGAPGPRARGLGDGQRAYWGHGPAAAGAAGRAGDLQRLRHEYVQRHLRLLQFRP